ncbi:MAG: hypothetical protein WC070_01375 [Candidatus Magasanikbacteria bacterium]
MLKNIINSILYIILTIIIFIFNFYFYSVLPFPFNTINFVIIYLLIFLGIKGHGNLVWLAFFSGFLMDLYSDLYFGVFTISLTFAFLFIYWLYYEFFTNKSVLSLTVMSVITILFFRTFYTGLFIFDGKYLNSDIFIFYLWEMFLTTFFVFIFYFFIDKFILKNKNFR